MICLRHCVLHYLLMVSKVFHGFESEFYDLVETLCVTLPVDGWKVFHVNESEFYDLFETISVTLPVDGWESSPYL